MDVLELIKADHRRVEELLGKIREEKTPTTWSGGSLK